MNDNIVGKIYILTNPSFPDYVKIGYSKNVAERINKLNNSEAVPFGFRLYATYDVETQSADKVLHKIIDKLNADLRSIDTINDKVRVREFYLISPEDAYELLEDISIIFPLSNLRKHHQNIGLNTDISPSRSTNPDRKISSINRLLYCVIHLLFIHNS